MDCFAITSSARPQARPELSVEAGVAQSSLGAFAVLRVSSVGGSAAPGNVSSCACWRSPAFPCR